MSKNQPAAKQGHTPGPWEVKKTLLGNNNKFVYSKNTSQPFLDLNGAEFLTESEAEANAHIIAAAPEMLEALRYASKLLEEVGVPTLSKKPIWKVIAKAEGRK